MIFHQDYIIKILFAALLGILIGLERKTKHYGLGARTSALIALSACAFTLVGISIFDPSNIARVIQGLAAGVGFIGGAIIWKHMHDHMMVYGITTAVTVWFLTAIGAMVAIGLYLESLVITIIALLILLLKRIGVE